MDSKFFLSLFAFGGVVPAILASIFMAGEAVNAKKSPGPVVKAAFELWLTREDRAPLNREKTSYLIHKGQQQKLFTRFEHEGWTSKGDDSNGGYIFENDESRMLVRFHGLSTYFETADLDIKPKPPAPVR